MEKLGIEAATFMSNLSATQQGLREAECCYGVENKQVLGEFDEAE